MVLSKRFKRSDTVLVAEDMIADLCKFVQAGRLMFLNLSYMFCVLCYVVVVFKHH